MDGWTELDALLAEIRGEQGGEDRVPVPHHLAYTLTNGQTVFVDYRVPIVVPAIRRVNKASMDGKYAAPSDRALIERWAREWPDLVCHMPFDNCKHKE